MERPIAIVASTVPMTMNLFYRDVIRTLQRTHTVHVVSSPGADLEALALQLGVTKHEISMERGISPVKDLIGLARWTRLLINVRPEVIITGTAKASLLGMAAGWALRTPKRLTYNGGLRLEGAAGRRRQVLALTEKVTGTFATAIVVNSESLLRRVRELHLYPPEKLHCTQPGSSHGVDTGLFIPGISGSIHPACRELDPHIPVIGFVGRLTRDKGIDTLLDALERIDRARFPFQLLVVGPRNEADSQHYLDRLASTSFPLTVTGRVDHIEKIYPLMTIHVLPSLREGFPNAVLEAAACAIPTITTDATGCIDSVRHGETGLLVPVANSNALTTSIEQLLANSDERNRLGQAARTWVQSAFRPEQVAASFLAPLQPLEPHHPRVLHVINNLGTGGAERLLADLLPELKSKGHDVHLAVLDRSSDESLAAALRSAEIPVTRLGSSRFDPRAWWRLWRMTGRSDIVHAHLFPAFWATAMTRARRKVMTEHSPTNRRQSSAILRMIDRIVYHRYATIIAVSDGVARSLAQRIGDGAPPITKIWNGVSLSKFGRAEQQEGSSGRFIVVGTLDDRKNVGLAIEALADSDGTLTVVGDGPERQSLERLANDLMPQRVTFTGVRDDIPELLANSDIFLVTSRYEGFGIAAVEAMMSGRPVIYPDIPGVGEIVASAGVAYRAGDRVALRTACKRVSADPVLYTQLARKARVRGQLFTIAETAAQYGKMYE